jgi:hypothetical protein
MVTKQSPGDPKETTVAVYSPAFSLPLSVKFIRLLANDGALWKATATGFQ